jgi:hypothetical protein
MVWYGMDEETYKKGLFLDPLYGGYYCYACCFDLKDQRDE